MSTAPAARHQTSGGHIAKMIAKAKNITTCNGLGAFFTGLPPRTGEIFLEL